MRGHCESCAFWDGTYCCGGFAEDDLTLDDIFRLNREAEEKGLIVDWRYGHCDSWQEYEEEDWEDVVFDNWRERNEIDR